MRVRISTNLSFNNAIFGMRLPLKLLTIEVIYYILIEEKLDNYTILRCPTFQRFNLPNALDPHPILPPEKKLLMN